MEESEENQEILLSSLKSLGIDIPPHITSIKDLDSSSFFSIFSQSLHLFFRDTNNSSFSTSLPDSMTEKVKSCTDMASFFQNLGYPSEISFHQNICVAYGSSCTHLKKTCTNWSDFLVERFSGLSEASKNVKFVDNVKLETLESNAQFIWRTKSEDAAQPLTNWTFKKKRQEHRMWNQKLMH